MAHNLDQSNGRYNIAFTGDRKSIWHRHGQQAETGWTLEQWAQGAGLGHSVIKVPAIAALPSPDFDHLPAEKRVVDTGQFFNARSDNGFILSKSVTDRYTNFQPIDLLKFMCEQVCGVDDHFQMSVAGALDHGRRIWATAQFNGDLSIAGEKHVCFVVASTSFDGSSATILWMSVVRVVCENTIAAALCDTSAMIRVPHSTRVDTKAAYARLTKLAQSVGKYKAAGDAMARVQMSEIETVDFFKQLLDVPADAKSRDDISTRKFNQLATLLADHRKSIEEGAEKGSVWAALQAVTRYVDHDRETRGDVAERDMNRFESAQFGSGADLKGKAMQLLLPRVKDKVLIPA